MQVGVNLGLVPETTPVPFAELVAMAEELERLGFDSLWLADHLLYREPDADDVGPLECWTALTAVAARVPRLRIGPFVLAAPFRNPAVLAKSAVTLDEISGGRLVLGIYWLRSPDELRTYRARLADACADEGRATPPLVSMSAYVVLEELGTAPADAPDTALRGSIETVGAGIAAYADVGVEHLILRPMPQGPEGLDALAEAVALARR